MELLTLFIISVAFGQTQENPTAFQVPANLILPDSPLYPIKQAYEGLNIAFTLNDTAKAQLVSKYAEMRLVEIDAEISKGNTNAAQVAEQDYNNKISDLQSIETRQQPDNHGQAVKAYVQSLLAQDDTKIGQLVSQFAQSNSSSVMTSSPIINNAQMNTENTLYNVTSDINRYDGNSMSAGRP